MVGKVAFRWEKGQASARLLAKQQLVEDQQESLIAEILSAAELQKILSTAKISSW